MALNQQSLLCGKSVIFRLFKRNTVAVASDGSAVLGLGNIGPEAAMPVMEGKAVLFKQFANVDSFPICLDTQDTEEIISVIKSIAPAFGGGEANYRGGSHGHFVRRSRVR
jgi:malic enzyme